VDKCRLIIDVVAVGDTIIVDGGLSSHREIIIMDLERSVEEDPFPIKLKNS